MENPPCELAEAPAHSVELMTYRFARRGENYAEHPGKKHGCLPCLLALGFLPTYPVVAAPYVK
jgi:hypothetical protein